MIGNNKYGPIHDFLVASERTERLMSFVEIERIIGCRLPASARKYPAWWANDATPSRQSWAWLSGGWETRDVDLAGELVRFVPV